MLRNTIRDLLADSNPTVVASAVAALVEISERSDDIMLRLNVTVAGKLVAALGECSEYVVSFSCLHPILIWWDWLCSQMGSSVHFGLAAFFCAEHGDGCRTIGGTD
jgi:hypothetical protein